MNGLEKHICKCCSFLFPVALNINSIIIKAKNTIHFIRIIGIIKSLKIIKLIGLKASIQIVKIIL